MLLKVINIQKLPNIEEDLEIVKFEHSDQYKNANPLIYYVYAGNIYCKPMQNFNSQFKIIYTRC